MLAAIVFTDVVGFTTLASMNETRALRLLERDSALIRKVSDAHGALVIKGTGDGMLLCFSSAVEAVHAAIEIQDQLQKQAVGLVAHDVLKHRIGVHLGDVVLLSGDVIGDGVNVASRIQNEAKPGGIALSDAVYSVVRGKVSIKAVNLGPRNLKHIVETVNLWMIPPHDDPIPTVAAQPTTTAPMASLELQATREESPSGGRLVMVVLGIVVSIVALAAISIQIFQASRSGAPVTAERSSGSERRDNAATSDSAVEDRGTATTPSPDQADRSTPATPATPDADPVAPAADEPDVSGFVSNYDFDAAAEQFERAPSPDRFATRIATLRQLGEFRRWIESSLMSATSENPVAVSQETGGRAYQVWSANGRLAVRLDDGSQREIQLRDFEPVEFPRLTLAILAKGGTTDADRQRAIGWVRDFAKEMRLRNLPSGL